MHRKWFDKQGSGYPAAVIDISQCLYTYILTHVKLLSTLGRQEGFR